LETGAERTTETCVSGIPQAVDTVQLSMVVTGNRHFISQSGLFIT